MAYIVGGMFLGLTWLFFNTSIVPGESNPITESNVRGYLEPTTLLFIIFSPLITMRLFSEEEKLGTLELLLTSPVKDWEIVMGKYLASTVILISTLLCTFFYVILISMYSTPDFGPLLSAYLGIILYGIATLGVGVFASSLSSNQIVSAVVGIVILLLLSFLDSLGAMLDGKMQGYGVIYVAINQRYEGQFKDDTLAGYGAIYKSDGTRDVGLFRDNQLIRSQSIDNHHLVRALTAAAHAANACPVSR